MRLTKNKSLIIIAVSGLVSVLIATTAVSYGDEALGALVYVYTPLIICTLSIILFLLLDFLIEGKREWLTFFFVVIMLIFGFLMRMDFYCHFINW